MILLCLSGSLTLLLHAVCLMSNLANDQHDLRFYSKQKPILLHGHERSLTQIKYNRHGDLLFSVAKDSVPTGVWSWGV